jgi:hypothetical protein
VVLTVLALPMLVLNSQNENTTLGFGLKELAKSTIGNLATSDANSTVSVYLPGCDSFSLLGSSCTFDGERISVLYSALDIVISIVVFLGFIWLTLFEQYEEIELSRSTSK